MMRLLLTTVLAWLFLSSATMAETGLERFEREIKPHIELKSFTYKGAETLGATGVSPVSGRSASVVGTLRVPQPDLRLS